MKFSCAKISKFFLFLCFTFASCDFFSTHSKISLSEILSLLQGKNADWKNAKIMAEKAAKQNPQDYRIKIILAAAYEQQGQISNAIDELKRAQKLAPNDFLVNFMLGRLYFMNSKFDDALSPLIVANKVEPKNNVATFMLAKTYQKLRQHRKAIELYKTIIRAPEFARVPDVSNEMAMILIEEGDYKNANICLNAAYKIAPENYRVLWNLAVFNDIYLKNSRSAIHFYNKFQEISLINPELAPKREIARNRINALRISSESL